jgi:hypothetical protein
VAIEEAAIWVKPARSFRGHWKHGEAKLKLPVRNYTAGPLTLAVEPFCEEYEIPPGGEAFVTLEDGCPHSIDVHPERWITLWDESACQTAEVKIFPKMLTIDPRSRRG